MKLRLSFKYSQSLYRTRRSVKSGRPHRRPRARAGALASSAVDAGAILTPPDAGNAANSSGGMPLQVIQHQVAHRPDADADRRVRRRRTSACGDRPTSGPARPGRAGRRSRAPSFAKYQKSSDSHGRRDAASRASLPTMPSRATGTDVVASACASLMVAGAPRSYAHHLPVSRRPPAVTPFRISRRRFSASWLACPCGTCGWCPLRRHVRRE